MNERIRELLDQTDIPQFPLFENSPPAWVASDSDIEKFAELIVKEAGALLMSPEFIGRSDLDWAMVLNEHFGVEE